MQPAAAAKELDTRLKELKEREKKMTGSSSNAEESELDSRLKELKKRGKKIESSRQARPGSVAGRGLSRSILEAEEEEEGTEEAASGGAQETGVAGESVYDPLDAKFEQQWGDAEGAAERLLARSRASRRVSFEEEDGE